MAEGVRCRKCGFENPGGLKFCGNCGSRLTPAAEGPRLEGLALLHVAGSLYLIVSVISNALVRASAIFTISYIASALLGLYAGYGLYAGKVGKWLKAASALAIAIGLVFTLLLFLIGLEIRGVIGPAWVIFLMGAWALWRGMARLRASY